MAFRAAVSFSATFNPEPLVGVQPRRFGDLGEGFCDGLSWRARNSE
jgi:hypothetical protein